MTTLDNVPAHLTIKVLYSDNDIIVIHKPCDLRSVPGHATPGAKTDGDVAESDEDLPEPKPRAQRLTAQEAWVNAIRSFGTEEGQISSTRKQATAEDDTQTRAVDELIRNLSITSDTPSIPRKCPTFERYCQRNRRRLLPSFPELDEPSPTANATQEPPLKRQKQSNSNRMSSELKSISQIAFSIIQQRQRPLMNLPEPTDDTESAIGQLRLFGFGDYAHNNHGPPETVDDVKKRISEGDGNEVFKLHVVHRLDCQTSGIMVVARNSAAASTLCHQWRERQSVKKTYLAFVRRWPPYHKQNLLEGSIDLPLAASRTERIKWEVRPVEDGGKASLTTWKVHESSLGASEEKDSGQFNVGDAESGITLELQPMTGRTHQLRIHCAAIGSGIEGDSLYGDSPIEWIGDKTKQAEHATNVDGDDQELRLLRPKTLRLHAHKLTFPHPTTGNAMTFESPKPW